MRILFCVNADLYGVLCLNRLAHAFYEHECRIFLSDTILRKGGRLFESLDLLHMVEQDILLKMLFPLLDKCGVRGKFRTFHDLSMSCGHAVETVNDINGMAAKATLKEYSPDIIISLRYGCIFGDEVIRVPRLGVLNLHSGLLPEYRGIMPTFWAMYNGSTVVGATLHRVASEGIDLGDIVSRREMRVQYEKSLFSNIVMVYEGGVDLVSDAIKRLSAGGKTADRRQNDGKYYTFPSEREVETFRRQGKTLISADEYISFMREYFIIAENER